MSLFNLEALLQSEIKQHLKKNEELGKQQEKVEITEEKKQNKNRKVTGEFRGFPYLPIGYKAPEFSN